LHLQTSFIEKEETKKIKKQISWKQGVQTVFFYNTVRITLEANNKNMSKY